MLKLFAWLGLFFVCLSLDFDVEESVFCVIGLAFTLHYFGLRQRLVHTREQLRRTELRLQKVQKQLGEKKALNEPAPTATLKSEPAPKPKESPSTPVLTKQLPPAPSTAPKLETKTTKPASKTKPRLPLPPLPKPSPSALRQSWQRLSKHWRTLWLPFLWQNIAWFIGALCLFAGSVFLMGYSQGFSKSFILLSSLSIYAAGLFWMAVRLAKQNKHATLVQVLLMLALGFVPLLLATLARLWLHADTGLQWLLAGGLSLLLWGGFALATQVGFAYLNRQLYPFFANLFFALASLQLAVPLLQNPTQVPWLILLHLALLAILFLAVWHFHRHQLPRLFFSEKPLAWFSLGSLVYASAISFVHLSLTPVRLEPGYFGVFIMGLAALWLYSDWHIQKWQQGQVWLGKVALLVYPLAVIALWVALAGGLGWLSLTTLMGVVLFSAMLWFYLTPAAFYALISFVSLLYALLVLRHFPHGWHFMLSLPLFLALFWLFNRLLYQRAQALLVPVQYSLYALISLTTFWSLIQAFPGWLPMLTPLSAALLLLHIGGHQVLNLPDALSSALRACYLSVTFAILTIAYMPLFLGSWALQFAWLLWLFALVSLLWGYYALGQWRNAAPCRCHPSVFFHSLVLVLSLSVFAVLYSGASLAAVLLLFLAGSLFFTLAWILRIRWFLIPVLLLWGVAAWQLKLYSGYVSSGGGLFWGVLLLWLSSFWLNHHYQQRPIAFPKPYPDEAVFALWRVNPQGYINPAHWLAPVLLPAAVVLWDLGLLYGGFLAFQGQLWQQPKTYWILAAASLVLALELQRWRWFLPVLLASFAWAVSLSFALNPAISFTASLLLLVLLSPWRWSGVKRLARLFYWYGERSNHVERQLHLYVLMLIGIASFSALQSPLLFAGLLSTVLVYISALIYFRHWRHPAFWYVLLFFAVLDSYVLYGLLQSVPYWQLSPFSGLSLALAWSLVLSTLYQRSKARRLKQVFYLSSTRVLPALALGVGAYTLAYAVADWQLSFLLLLIALNVWLLPVKAEYMQPMYWLRGLVIPIALTSAFLVVLVSQSYLNSPITLWSMVFWGFALWAVALYLPGFDAQSKQDSACQLPIAAAPWRWLGMWMLVGALSLEILHVSKFYWLSASLQMLLLALALIIYQVLMLRFCYRAWLRHSLALLIVLSGLGALNFIPHVYALTAGFFIWLNLLFALSWASFAQRDTGYIADLLRAYAASFLIFGFSLAWAAAYVFYRHKTQLDWELLVVALASAASFLHLYRLRSYSLYINFLWFSGLSALLLLLLPWLSLFFINLAALLLLWLALTLVKNVLFLQWTRLWLVLLSLASLFFVNFNHNMELFALSLVFAWIFVSLWRLNGGWLIPAQLSAAALLHLAWLPFVEGIPWFYWALQDSLLLNQLSPRWWQHKRLLAPLPWLAHLSWGLGLLMCFLTLPLSLSALLAGIASAALLARLAYYQAAEPQRLWLLAAWLMAGLLLGRYYLFGWALPQLFDTLMLLSLAVLLSIWQHQFDKNHADYQRLYVLILALVSLASLSLLGQLNPLSASLSLFAGASLLLFLPERRPLALYLSMLLLNLALYIWLPSWVAKTHLLQLYLMPAAITLLLFVQLQQHLLLHKRVHQLRLLALGALYSAATLDFFQQQGLLVFSLALALSLGGIILGIAFRIRAFLYMGTVFLTVFIASQLLQFYPEDSLSKGLIFMGLGLLIIGAMFVIQLKREALMQQWQRWREDLQQWQ